MITIEVVRESRIVTYRGSRSTLPAVVYDLTCVPFRRPLRSLEAMEIHLADVGLLTREWIGSETAKLLPCGYCEGSGTIEWGRCVKGGIEYGSKVCPDCRGDGVLPSTTAPTR